jgi:dihydroxy-acid dehydratase
MDEILKERKQNYIPHHSKYKKGALRLFAEHAASPMKGAYLDFDD